MVTDENPTRGMTHFRTFCGSLNFFVDAYGTRCTITFRMVHAPTTKRSQRSFDQLWIKPATKARVAAYAAKHGLKLYRAADALLNARLDQIEREDPHHHARAH